MANLTSILSDAQGDTGIDLSSVTTESVLCSHLLRYRQRLLAFAGVQWKDVETGDTEIAIGVGDDYGWSFNWGYNWGGRSAELVLAVGALEGIWVVKAHHIVDDAWVDVTVVTRNDADAELRPQLLLRQAEVVLLHFAADWDGIYDTLRFEALPVPSTDVAMNVELAPNALIEPVFSRCLVLEASRFLAMKNSDIGLAGGIAAELTIARNILGGQAAAQSKALSLGISNGSSYS